MTKRFPGIHQNIAALLASLTAQYSEQLAHAIPARQALAQDGYPELSRMTAHAGNRNGFRERQIVNPGRVERHLVRLSFAHPSRMSAPHRAVKWRPSQGGRRGARGSSRCLGDPPGGFISAH